MLDCANSNLDGLRGKLDAVSQRTTKLADVSSDAFQTICSKLENTELSSCGRYKRHQESLAQIDDRLQVLQRQLELGPFLPSISLVRPATIGQRERPGVKTTVAATVYWTSRSYSLAIGTLHAQVRMKRRCSGSAESGAEESEQLSINLTFAPPRWLSNIMLRYDLESCRNYKSALPGLTFNITPLSVNNNRLLRQAIEQADVAGLRGLFQADLARPTDQIPRAYGSQTPTSLLNVSFSILQRAFISLILKSSTTVNGSQISRVCNIMTCISSFLRTVAR